MSSVSGHPEYFKKEFPLEIQSDNAVKIIDIAWSPNGQFLAVAAQDGLIRIFDIDKYKAKFTLTFGESLNSISWSYDSRLLAAIGKSNISLWDSRLGIQLQQSILEQSNSTTILCSDWAPIEGGSLAYATDDHKIHLWNSVEKTTRVLIGHNHNITCLKWHIDGRRLASGTDIGAIGVWWEDAIDNQLRLHYTDHNPAYAIRCFAWRPNGQVLASCADDFEIHIRDTNSNLLLIRIVGEEPFVGLAFDRSGQFLTTKSFDDKIQVWRINLNNLSYQLVYEVEESCDLGSSLLFQNPTNKLLATVDQTATSVNIWNTDFDLLSCQHEWANIPYQARKVMLCGESTLFRKKALRALSALSHSNFRCENRLSLGEISMPSSTKKSKIIEVILWNELQDFSFSGFDRVRIKDSSLIVFVVDAKIFSEKNTQAINSHPLIELSGSSNIQILYLIIDESGFHEYLKQDTLTWLAETGVRNAHWLDFSNSHSIENIRKVIYKIISSRSDNIVSTYTLYNAIEAFYDIKKENNELIHSLDKNYQQFLDSSESFSSKNTSLDDFKNCLTCFELAGKIYFFELNNTIFLEPSLTYSYVDAMSKAASKDTSKLGRLEESRLSQVDIPIHQDCRVKDRHQEQLLIMAITSMLDDSNLIFKASTGTGSYWVFPSESQAVTTLSENNLARDIKFLLEGKLKDAYSYVVTKLEGSTVFKTLSLWKNISLFENFDGEVCGLEFIELSEGKGEFNLAYEPQTSLSTRNNFASFVRAQLQSSPSELSYDEVENKTFQSVTEHSPTRNQVFICYNSKDIENVEYIVNKLRDREVKVWYDKDMRAGDSVLSIIEQQILASSVILILLGKHGLGKWQDQEYRSAMTENDGRIIPVLLPGFDGTRDIPFFLRAFQHVDFREFDHDNAIDKIVRAISNSDNAVSV